MPTIATKTVKNTEVKESLKKISRKKTVSRVKEDVLVSPVTAVKKGDEYGEVFSTAPNPSLLAQYIRVYQFNQRQGNAHSKTRGEVAGSGKKPWKQKGTGRARVGSIRTPVWRHGGVSHGPLTKDWSLNISDKMKRAAFRVALSQKVADSALYYVDRIELSEGRTKAVVSTLASWKLKGDVLIVTGTDNPHLRSGSSNLRTVEVVNYDSLNAYQILARRNIIFEKLALDKIKDRYAKNK